MFVSGPAPHLLTGNFLACPAASVIQMPLGSATLYSRRDTWRLREEEPRRG